VCLLASTFDVCTNLKAINATLERIAAALDVLAEAAIPSPPPEPKREHLVGSREYVADHPEIYGVFGHDDLEDFRTESEMIEMLNKRRVGV